MSRTSSSIVLIALGVSSMGLSFADTGSDMLRAFPYSEAQAQRYRINISPTHPDVGIASGYVIAYGYYILPPYEVTAQDGSTYYGEQKVLDSWLRRRVLDMSFHEVVANHLWLPLGAAQV